VDTAVLAFTSLSMVPAVVFFLIFQKRIVGGLTGAVKCSSAHAGRFVRLPTPPGIFGGVGTPWLVSWFGVR
jgi:hypothetical protein